VCVCARPSVARGCACVFMYLWLVGGCVCQCVYVCVSVARRSVCVCVCVACGSWFCSVLLAGMEGPGRLVHPLLLSSSLRPTGKPRPAVAALEDLQTKRAFLTVFRTNLE
jgi:hypothetical protein